MNFLVLATFSSRYTPSKNYFSLVLEGSSGFLEPSYIEKVTLSGKFCRVRFNWKVGQITCTVPSIISIIESSSHSIKITVGHKLVCWCGSSPPSSVVAHFKHIHLRSTYISYWRSHVWKYWERNIPCTHVPSSMVSSVIVKTFLLESLVIFRFHLILRRRSSSVSFVAQAFFQGIFADISLQPFFRLDIESC